MEFIKGCGSNYGVEVEGITFVVIWSIVLGQCDIVKCTDNESM